ncbi:MAG: DUF1684 domain-containing protein [Deltaproteobacteria bacterium]|nr:DUF1684 domain-containing protein [Deltaproteobacteria bacterium]
MTPDQQDRWRSELEEFRREKDGFLRRSPSSPIPREHGSRFKGLAYYPADIRYYFEVELHRFGRPESIEIQDTGGNLRKFLIWGEFRFEVDGRDCVLHAYKSSPRESNFFVPFRDTTSGKETYGAGRYMDLYEERDRTNWGWVLDFNLAYNPYCAYSPHYVCPFVPPENWLDVAIRAGEKSYPLAVT